MNHGAIGDGLRGPVVGGSRHSGLLDDVVLIVDAVRRARRPAAPNHGLCLPNRRHRVGDVPHRGAVCSNLAHLLICDRAGYTLGEELRTASTGAFTSGSLAPPMYGNDAAM